jgi:hypothetical protein
VGEGTPSWWLYNPRNFEFINAGFRGVGVRFWRGKDFGLSVSDGVQKGFFPFFFQMDHAPDWLKGRGGRTYW